MCHLRIPAFGNVAVPRLVDILVGAICCQAIARAVPVGSSKCLAEHGPNRSTLEEYDSTGDVATTQESDGAVMLLQVDVSDMRTSDLSGGRPKASADHPQISAPRPLNSTRGALSHQYCQWALNERRHVFHGMWAHSGMVGEHLFSLSQGRHRQTCWSSLSMTKHQYFHSVRSRNVSGYSCDRNWMAPMHSTSFAEGAAMILGNDRDMLDICSPDPYAPPNPNGCADHNMHLLYLQSIGMEHWNMCRNFEFVACGAMGALPKQGGGLAFFATAPRELRPDEITREPQRRWTTGEAEYLGSEVIFLLEVCLLDKLCSNHEELFATGKREYFRCEFDERGFQELRDWL